MRVLLLLAIVLALSNSNFPVMAADPTAADGNRLTYLAEFCDPYYVGRDFPKLTTPQWVGEEDVEAVVVLAIDDMRDTAKYEAYFRPILERLKQIDGRAPVSIMTCNVDPADPQLQIWLKEGLSIECHTIDHPCPLLQGGDFAKAKSTYDRCVDLMNQIPDNKPVAFRMPCCDSLNTPSPRFWTEIFNKTTENGNYLQIDTSVFNITTSNDKDLPRELVLDADGKERFRKYLPFKSFVNTIEDYPYPYIIGGACWEFPCIVPSDWEAQNIQQPNNPQTVEDMKAALDAVVIKQGTFNLVFHPHGWIRNDQIVELIDHAVEKHGTKVKFLTFREAIERINANLFDGESIRHVADVPGHFALVDSNGDGYLDVHAWGVQSSGEFRKRTWNPRAKRWEDDRIPGSENQPNGRTRRGSRVEITHGFRGAVVHDVHGDGILDLIQQKYNADGTPSSIHVRSLSVEGSFPCPGNVILFNGGRQDAGLRLVDVNDDGFDDMIFSNAERYSLHLWKNREEGWSIKVIEGTRGQEGGIGPVIPMIVRADATNNGAWFHSRSMWVQNEDTNRLPDLVDRLSFDDMLKEYRRQQDEKAELPGAKSPNASRDAIRVRPGMRVELVVSEPLVADPVAFDWGPDGSLWVAEMGDYPNGATWNKPGDPIGEPGGRVRRLIDEDGDGRYDRSTVFLDKIPFPNGVKAWRKGVLVTAAPEIFYAEDTDGDGVADKRETLYQGFVEGNQQHRVNGLRWGLDNWLYLANGDSGGTVKSIKTGQSIDIRGRDLRIRPDTGELEAISGQTQFGRNCDDWGNWFGGNNSNPMWHYVLDDHYQRRNPHYASPDDKHHISNQPGASPVFPTSRTLTRFNDFDKADRFTSACSPIIYRDELLFPRRAGDVSPLIPASGERALNQGTDVPRSPESTQAFICEPVHNLVHREVVTAAGATFTSRRADDERQSEFLASSDSWFRPTMIRTGPDGALWVADMYRLVIEHPEWIPQDWQERLDVRSGHDRGRIYRIVPDEGDRPRVPRLDRLDTKSLVAQLESSNGTLRDLAQQMLTWRSDAQAAAPLKALAANGKTPPARLHALCTLAGMGALDADAVAKALRDEHPGVRRHAIRLSEQLVADNPDLLNKLAALVVDNDPHVRMQLAYSAGQWNDNAATAGVLAKLLSGEQDDVYLRAASFSSLNKGNAGDVLAHAIGEGGANAESLAGDLLTQATALGARESLLPAVERLGRPDAKGQFAAEQIAAAARVLAEFDRNEQLAETSALARGRLAPLMAFARKQFDDPAAGDELQIASLTLLRFADARDRPSAEKLQSLLEPQFA
ncbi:MAG: HEAT repeat domain-containing protein, partial [Planctomycetota bacterium]|nr:HEAT repeat domain-containing protein [Planctomycetota bacterium]